jgi:hypothetical protein
MGAGAVTFSDLPEGAKVLGAPSSEENYSDLPAGAKVLHAAQGAPAKAEEPGFLDKDIPLAGPWYNPTLSGLQSVGRGFREVGHAIAHPIDAATETVKSLANLPYEAASVPGAIRDINASPDPLAHYARAAQDTAGEGAAQAATGAATEGLIKAAPPIARAVGGAAKPIVRGGLRVVSDFADPDVTGIVSPRFAHVQRVAGKIADRLEPKPVYPGAHLPEAPPVYPGAPLPEHPGVFPGAPLPETPAPAVLQANSLLRRPVQVADPSAGLGEVPTRSEGVAPIARPAKATPRSVVSKRLETGLNEGLGAGVPEGHTPVESSAVKSFKYDPDAHELEVHTKSGVTYVTGEVTPAQAEAFSSAKSKGQAWKAIRDNNPPVAKIVNGTRIPVKPSSFRSVTPTTPAPEEDLTPLLLKSLERARSRRIPTP